MSKSKKTKKTKPAAKAKKKVVAKPVAKKQVAPKPSPKPVMKEIPKPVMKESPKPVVIAPPQMEPEPEILDITPIPPEHMDHHDEELPLDEDIKNLKGFDDPATHAHDADEDDF